jgi:hypothetical protein
MTQTAEQFWLDLEAERYDITYRRPRRKGLTPLLPKEQQEVWFQAGRYAEGARDPKARRGNAEAGRLAGLE